MQSCVKPLASSSFVVALNLLAEAVLQSFAPHHDVVHVCADLYCSMLESCADRIEAYCAEMLAQQLYSHKAMFRQPRCFGPCLMEGAISMHNLTLACDLSSGAWSLAYSSFHSSPPGVIVS